MHPEPHRFPETQTALRLLIELGLMLVLSIFVFFIAASFDMFEQLVGIVWRYENWELDELIIVAVFLVMALSVFSVKHWLAFRKVNAVLIKRNRDLQQAMTQLRELNGIIPICSWLTSRHRIRFLIFSVIFFEPISSPESLPNSSVNSETRWSRFTSMRIA